MSFTKRCCLFFLGLTLWVFVVIEAVAFPPFNGMGVLHAGLAAAVASSAFLPRRALSWSE